MVSFTQLLTLLSVLVAVSHAEDAGAHKPEEVDQKWLYGGRWNSYYGNGWGLWNSYNPWYTRWSGLYNTNFYGYQCFNYAPGYFIKATDDAKNVSRRTINLDAEHLTRRNAGETVTCTTHGKAPQTFSVNDCLATAHQLVDRKTSTATVGNCQLSLVHGTEKVAPGSITAKELEQGVQNILKACSQSSQEKEASAKQNNKVDEKQVFMLMSSPQ